MLTLILLLALPLLVAVAMGGWFVYQRLPLRSGVGHIDQLAATVQVRYDERGVPHIKAQNQFDLYRALGYVHAQDRLFQMEMVRRLGKGELAEILGPKLVETDTLFRTIGLRENARRMLAAADPQSASAQYLQAYVDGINQYQDTHKPPLEFTLMGIEPQPFTAEDVYVATNYLAYNFAAALRIEPVMTVLRDKLGTAYLRPFANEWNNQGVLQDPSAEGNASAKLQPRDWKGLMQLATLSQSAMDLARVPMLAGSNGWAVSGARTASGKPILAGDPHIGFAAPSVWYEAHLQAPDFEIYGHFAALMPWALLGHNQDFGWTLTMFQNDDMDLVAEKTNPDNRNQVWNQGQWVDLKQRTEAINVKGGETVQLTVRQSPHGPIISDSMGDKLGSDHKTPIALWWTNLATDNQSMEAFFALNRADTLAKARAAASKVGAPGVNIIWANASGDIGWWAAAKLPQRPAGVNPTFILDGGKGEADKPGYYAFSFNPQEENPRRGYIVSANQQPLSAVPVAGNYNEPDRARTLDKFLSNPATRWDSRTTQGLQLLNSTDYSKRVLGHLLPLMQTAITDKSQQEFVEPLLKWDGDFTRDSIAATLYTQMLYELSVAIFHDELDDDQFANLLRLRNFNSSLDNVLADPNSPWWDNVETKNKETAQDIVALAWSRTLAHLNKLYGSSLLEWTWGKSHLLTHGHPLGRKKPLDKIFDVGPFEMPGGNEVPNNMAFTLSPAPWRINYGPSTRRVIDFADASKAMGINPVGQSGVWLDKHYNDQADAYAAGMYQPMYLKDADITAHTDSILTLSP
ncbi:penicillin acylase family protein [Curvibacter sp. CHRR-16]|nr:penicillin acylase family protein [Curvibacter sp. CHRR-16]